MLLPGLVVLLLWCSGAAQGATGDPLPRDKLTSWFRLRVLEALGLEEPPPPSASNQKTRNLGRREPPWRPERREDRGGREQPERMQIILFAKEDISCAGPVAGPSTPFTFLFQPSINHRMSQLTSAQLWFFSSPGLPLNSSGPVSVLIPGQQVVVASPGPSWWFQDGWVSYDLNKEALESVGGGPFWLRVHCPQCRCWNHPDKTPFLNLVVKSRRRIPRSVSLPWSLSAMDLLQRPSQETHGDCGRAHVDISFEELGWDSWIVFPKTLTFYFCHGNCSSPERTAVRLGVTQCCAPIPGSMQSIRITTTSDGGYSFKYETLPNIMPEECTCI